MSSHIHDLKLAIVGAGVGGLTTALTLAKRGFKNISVYESAPELGFVGAGIQLAPNLARVLDRLGVWDLVKQNAVLLNDTSMRRGQDDTELGRVDFRPIKDIHGYPHMVAHRASLIEGLYQGCIREKSIAFHFGTTITRVTEFGPQPRFEAVCGAESSSFEVRADLVLAADGIKSLFRVAILEKLGHQLEIVDTGTAAYRIMLHRKDLEHDAELLELIDRNTATRWIAPGRYIIAYPVENNTIYNISTGQPDDNFAQAPSSTYQTQGSKESMLREFGDFCPLVRRLLELVDERELLEWKLLGHEHIPTWFLGSVALIGDACHPSQPHLAQGAAQAIEDGAVLGVLLSRMNDGSEDSIRKALNAYEAVRKERARTLVDLAAASGKNLRMAAGEEQEKRDKQLAATKSGDKGGQVPDRWADPAVQNMVYGFDCVKAAEDYLEKVMYGAKL